MQQSPRAHLFTRCAGLLPVLALLLGANPVAAAGESFPVNDVRDLRERAYAFVHATAVVAPGTVIEDATILIRDGRIEAVRPGAGEPSPAGYATIDLTGRHVYPGLIDLYSNYGLPAPDKGQRFGFGQPEVIEPQRPGAYNANDAIRANYRAAADFEPDQESAARWRGMGFGAALTFRADGIARGRGALVSLADGSANETLLVADVAAFYSFDKGSSKQSFPISTMGSVALLRQTFLDAAWFAQHDPRPFADESLEGWLASQSRPQIFEARGWKDVLRADRFGDEFGVQYVMRGAGDEYQRIDAMAATGATFIVPLAFPEPEDVSDPLDAERISLSDLKHWELAPGNPAALEAAGVTLALTSGGDSKNFRDNLRKAIDRGLTEETALAALTTVPAELLAVGDELGRIEAGARANLLITSGPLFAEETVLEENWISGERYLLARHTVDRSGRYALRVGERRWTLELSGTPVEPKARLLPDETAPTDTDADGATADTAGEKMTAKESDAGREATIAFDEGTVTLRFEGDDGEPPLRLSGWVTATGWRGRGQGGDGVWIDWRADPLGPLARDRSEDPPSTGEAATPGPDPAALAQTQEPEAHGVVTFPFAPYGWTALPETESILIRGATVWTMEADGVLEDTDVLLRDGVIAAVGTSLEDSVAGEVSRIIDAAGRHLTPGIIDEHSHIALDGVNDVATLSAMVRMSDVVDSEDVNIYRNLAGGVTAAQLLHGSANPVGGQSALVKMRWGRLPEEMLIEDAPGFIKFALGENVKRSGNDRSVRYPRTRMGVEQVFRGAFTEARAYRERHDAWRQAPRNSRGREPRRDLVLDALAEILAQERFISCHSYVQSEINMLMHVAEDFDFRVNTFTHILEGYKVADKMAAHGAGGSTFADWWAYKWEVRYAIPYNPTLMHEAGVVAAVNSDSAEMSRRLNQEAAKAVKYGGLGEVEALAMVTINPARLLRLDDRMGSIRAGKDGDLVLWSHHPLSIDARAEKTFVDGVLLYDRSEAAERHAAVGEERARLVAKMLAAGGRSKGKPAWSGRRQWECESLHGFEHLTAGTSAGGQG